VGGSVGYQRPALRFPYDQLHGGIMKERPILFSTPMVKAILEGRKTQTRRIKKLEWLTSDHCGIPICDWGLSRYISCENGLLKFEIQEAVDDSKIYEIQCPYGQVGDLLWVRETFAVIDDREFENGTIYTEYKADRPNDKYPGDWPEDEAKGNPEAPKWKPSIFMPKKYARIWLEITDIRVERLQDIDPVDCINEGIEKLNWLDDEPIAAIERFSLLWDSINGKKHPWSSNPFCWVITFRRIKNE